MTINNETSTEEIKLGFGAAFSKSFFPCLLLHLFMPLLPLVLESLFKGSCSTGSLAITAAMYGIALAISSKWTWFVFAGIFICIIYSCFYAALSLGWVPTITVSTYTIGTIIFLFGAHLLERVIKHLIYREPFFEFSTR